MISKTGMVYVVDDDQSVRSALTRLFRSSGFQIQVFESAEAFLESRLGRLPSCLILDVRMPGLSGLDLQQVLNENFESVPIIFLTGHGDIPMSVKAMKAGAFDFLPKPVDNSILLDTVDRAIHKHSDILSNRAEIIDYRKRLETLTAREREVFERVVDGLLNKNIGSELGITEATVKVHRGRVMEKMGVDSVAELARLSERANLQ